MYDNEIYEKFEVSNDGRIRNANTQRVYKTFVNKNGYVQICVSLGSRKKQKVFKLHRAIAETFIPNPDNKPEVNHKDGNKENNRITNLEWSTGSENIRHAYATGLLKPKLGVDRPNAKLTVEDVLYIREHYTPRDKEYGAVALGKKFGVNNMQIIRTARKEKYTNI